MVCGLDEDRWLLASGVMGELTEGRKKESWDAQQSIRPRDEKRVAPSLLIQRLREYEEGRFPLSNLLPYLEHHSCWKLFHGAFLFKADDALVVRLRQMPIDKNMILWLSQGIQWRYFLRLCRAKNAEALHDFDAAAKAVFWFGDKAEAFVNKTGRTLHDAGINLPMKDVDDDKRAFLWRYAPKLDRVIRVLGFWKGLQDHGCNVMGKEGLHEAEKTIAKLRYAGALNDSFAQVAAECGVSEHDYLEYEARWLKAQTELKHQTVPAPKGIRDGEYYLLQLDKGDPRGLFAGALTSCCQHPSGMARSCAWHAAESPNGAIWAVFKGDKMLTQGWVWRPQSGDRLEDALVIDNVEIHVSARVLESAHINGQYRKLTDEEKAPQLAALIRIAALYRQAAEQAIGRLKVKAVYAGFYSGYMHYPEIALGEGPRIPNPFNVPTSYTDARSVWCIAQKEGKENKPPRARVA